MDIVQFQHFSGADQLMHLQWNYKGQRKHQKLRGKEIEAGASYLANVT